MSKKFRIFITIIKIPAANMIMASRQVFYHRFVDMSLPGMDEKISRMNT